MAMSAQGRNPWDAWTERTRLYTQQRNFAFSAAKSLKPTAEESEKAMALLRSLRKEKFPLYSRAYEDFLKQHKLNRSLHSLKLMFMDIEAGIKEAVIPHDETTIFILIDEISHRQETHTQKKRRRYTPAQTLHHTSAPARPRSKQPTAEHAAAHPVPLAIDFTLNDMLRHNIEALQYYLTTLMTTEDYMKFIFTNKDIEAQFHRYINNILVHKTDGHKFLQLEEHINNRRVLMDKLSQLPKNGQTFLLPEFNNNVFVVPCSKDEYMTKYCQENDFYLPPGKELLTSSPTHPGLYRHTMNGIKQIDPNCTQNTVERRLVFGRGKRLLKHEEH